MRLFATVTTSLLAAVAVSGDAAPAETAAEDVDTSDTRIGIHRLEAINELTGQIWNKMRSEHSGGTHHTLRKLNSSLRSSVWEYNRLREDLCNDRFIIAQSCGAAFLPKWALDPKRNATTLDELDTREAELEGHVTALWDAACARLEKAISWEDSRPYCSIE